MTTATPPEILEQAPLRPWSRGWFYVAPGEGGTFAWLLLLHVCGLAVFFAPLPAWPYVALTVACTFLGVLGTTVVYHRALSHKAAKLNGVVEQVLIFFAVFTGGGAPVPWVANHRKHHAKSDTLSDISSPNQGGFWWSHIRWMWQADQADPKRYCPDLLRSRRYTFWSKAQGPLLLLSLFGPLAFGFGPWVWLGPLRLLYALHGITSTNSVCHLGKPRQGRDRSINVGWLTPFFFGLGENWHQNHHDRPASARFGHGRQLDLGYRLLCLFQRMGLARDVRG